jgi:site-specific DNA-methyltransferase (adenine-specific)
MTNKKYQVIYADPPWKFYETSYVLVPESWGGKTEDIGSYTHKKKIYPTLTKQELMELKINKYQVVYADPPWKYDNRIDNAYTSKQKFDENGKQYYPALDIDNHYPTLESKEIAELPIKELVDKDAVCFMWTTDTHMPQALEIMKAWGFTYKTIAFVWEKQTNLGNPVCLLSPWTHKTYEICLLGTRGAMMKNKKDNKIRQMVKAERTRHSAKPQEVADRIVRMFPDCARIELFARDAKPGWDVWGNEINNTIEL